MLDTIYHYSIVFCVYKQVRFGEANETLTGVRGLVRKRSVVPGWLLLLISFFSVLCNSDWSTPALAETLKFNTFEQILGEDAEVDEQLLKIPSNIWLTSSQVR